MYSSLVGGFAGNDGHASARALGCESYDDLYDVERWMGAFTMRKNLSETKTLVSPLDAKAIAEGKSITHFARRPKLRHRHAG